jgi:hypothetical protein
MAKSTADKHYSEIWHKRKWLRVFTYVLIAYVASMLLPIVSPYSRYPVYLLKCGHPPVAGSDFAASYDYQLPEDANYSINPFTNAYFCTEQEARDENYHHEP